MKFVSGISALLGVSMLLNAFEGVWAFDRVSTGTKWVVLDVVIAFALFSLSYGLYRLAKFREYQELFADAQQREEFTLDDFHATILNAGHEDDESDNAASVRRDPR